MILRPAAISTSSLGLIAALLFGGMMMYDTVAGGHEMYAVAVAEAAPSPPPDAWMVPTTLTSNNDAACAFVQTWAQEAFDMSANCQSNHDKATAGIAPLMRESFASMFWDKPACGHDVKFFLTSVDPVDMGATNGAWFEVHGMFQHGKMEMLPVTVAVLVGGTSKGGMQVEGYSELTDPLDKLMVASCDSEKDCDESKCEEHDKFVHIPGSALPAMLFDSEDKSLTR